MAKIYYRRIKNGQMTINDVPMRWRAAVQTLLEADLPQNPTETSANTENNTPPGTPGQPQSEDPITES